MKIIQLTAENVKKLTAIEISPDGNMVQITGKNGQGKTSVLDSIWWALAGTENVQAQPIRNGAEKARIEIKLGNGGVVELTVERRFTEKGSSLSVKTADGAKYPSPQKMLDDLLGSLTFDPLHFMRQDATGQFEVLRQLVALDVDPAALDAANAKDFAARTDINRDAKAKRAQAAAIVVPDDLPDSPVDESALLDTLQQAADANAQIEQRRANRTAASLKIENLTSEAARLEAALEPDADAIQQVTDREVGILQQQIDNLTHQRDQVQERAIRDIAELKKTRTAAIEAATQEAASIKTKLDDAGDLPDPVDISELRAQLDSAKAINLKVAQRDSRKTIEEEAATLEGRSAALTTAMEARTKQKLDAIAKAPMPVEGLSFGDGTLTFKGVPLDQASDAEQLTVSTAIAAALNPKLRVIRIRDGSLLDDEALAKLAVFAKERDFQIWIEIVNSSSPCAIVMEDGHVKDKVLAAAE